MIMRYQYGRNTLHKHSITELRHFADILKEHHIKRIYILNKVDPHLKTIQTAATLGTYMNVPVVFVNGFSNTCKGLVVAHESDVPFIVRSVSKEGHDFRWPEDNFYGLLWLSKRSFKFASNFF